MLNLAPKSDKRAAFVIYGFSSTRENVPSLQLSAPTAYSADFISSEILELVVHI